MGLGYGGAVAIAASSFGMQALSTIFRRAAEKGISLAMIFSSYLASVFLELRAYMGRLILRILAVGPIPEHIAIIMDGNRRFAGRARIETTRGHEFGYERLIDTLENCLELGVKYVSVYAFAIENFGRPEAEVNSLMALIEEKLDSLVKEEGLAREFGVRIQVLGDLTLLPTNVRAAAERAMAATHDNTTVVLNVCVAYNSTEEIVHSIQDIRDDIVGQKTGIPNGGRTYPRIGRRRARSRSKLDAEDSSISDLATEDRNNDAQLKLLRSKFSRWLKRQADSCLQRTAHRNGNLEFGQDVDSARLCMDGVSLDSRTWSSQEGGQLTSPESDNLRPSEIESPQEPRQAVSLKADCLRSQEDGQLHCSSEPECLCEDEYVSCSGASQRFSSLDVRKKPVATPELITEKVIENHLYTAGCPPPDLLIRTSGETRLSNFMLWQCSHSQLSFCSVLWPEFKLKDLVWIILDYQRSFAPLQNQRRFQEQLFSSSKFQPD